MIRYLLGFKTMTDVAVRTAILSLAIALVGAVANLYNFRHFLPELQSQTSAIAFIGGFIVSMLLSVPVTLVFFSTWLEINRLNEKMAELADLDHLTGLKNRRKFFDEISVAHAESGEVVVRQRGTLLIVDVDHFKSINDGHGHQAGDEALVHIAQLLKRGIRDLDVVARLGGEEFGIFLIDADKVAAQEIAERIRIAIFSTPVMLQHGPVGLSISIGGSEVWPLQSLAECMRRADLLLYAAKSAGRNRVKFSDPLRVKPYIDAALEETRLQVNAQH
jgi:diguanylate cyclase (GGDEF)-like protein